ncbi:MAG: type II toxin-antitoxin system VapC family toxin [Caldilineae bacterium]|nr:type II toxin-antitoxin system VapC family toxin [Chloroflexota bacterium]MCB9176029.1 type II toxin-antitoxin system VapC family toxin [Caldilineae bacterium]
MIVVDASVWVAWLTASDAHHAQSRAWLATWLDRSRTLTTPELAIVEVAGAIARRSGRPELGRRAAAAVMACPSLDVYRMEAHDVRLATTLAADRRLRGADAIYVALAQALDLPLVTWDAEQIENSRGLVEAHRPT